MSPIQWPGLHRRTALVTVVLPFSCDGLGGSVLFTQKILLAFLGSSCAISLPLNRRASAAVQCEWKSGTLARRRKNKTMKRSNAVRAIFWLGMIFAVVFLVRAESGDRRTSTPHTKSAPPIRILDQNGQPAVNGVPSATSTIVDVTTGGGNGIQFVPDTVNI